MVEVAVDGRPVQPNRHEDGDLVIDLGGSQGSGSHRVAFVYESEPGAPLSWWDTAALELPRLAEVGGSESPLVVERTHFSLFLPSRFEVGSVAGDLRRSAVPSLWQREIGLVIQDGGRALPPSDRGGLTVALEPDGHSHTFARVGDGGAVSVGIISRSALGWSALLPAAIALVGTWLLRHRQALIALAGVIAAVFVLGLSGPWWAVAAGGAGGLGLGIGVLVARSVLLGCTRWWRSRRADRLLPHPFLEGAGVSAGADLSLSPETAAEIPEALPTEPSAPDADGDAGAVVPDTQDETPEPPEQRES